MGTGTSIFGQQKPGGLFGSTNTGGFSGTGTFGNTSAFGSNPGTMPTLGMGGNMGGG